MDPTSTQSNHPSTARGDYIDAVRRVDERLRARAQWVVWLTDSRRFSIREMYSGRSSSSISIMPSDSGTSARSTSGSGPRSSNCCWIFSVFSAATSSACALLMYRVFRMYSAVAGNSAGDRRFKLCRRQHRSEQFLNLRKVAAGSRDDCVGDRSRLWSTSLLERRPRHRSLLPLAIEFLIFHPDRLCDACDGRDKRHGLGHFEHALQLSRGDLGLLGDFILRPAGAGNFPIQKPSEMQLLIFRHPRKLRRPPRLLKISSGKFRRIQLTSRNVMTLCVTTMRRPKPFSIYPGAEMLARVTAIAESEGRAVGRQMLRFIERGIRRYESRKTDRSRRRSVTNVRESSFSQVSETAADRVAGGS